MASPTTMMPSTSAPAAPPAQVFTFPDGPGNTFDPYNQTVSFFQPNGTEIILPFAAIDAWQNYLTQGDATGGACVGASFVLMIVLIVATRPEKRKNLLFVLNVLTLLFNFLSLLLTMLFDTSPAAEFYNWFTLQSGPQWTSIDESNTLSATVINYFCYVTLEASLFLQAYVVSKTFRPIWRWAIIIFSALLVLGFMALRFAFGVFNIEDNVGNPYTPGYTYSSYEILSLELPVQVYFSATVFWFTLIFTAKLGMAIWQRRKIGVKNFGPLEIVFVMGCQSMIVPTFFLIIQFFIGVDFFNYIVRTLTCLSLPLSTIWATANSDEVPQVPFSKADHRVVRAKPIAGGAAAKANAAGNGNAASGSGGDSTVVASSPTGPITPKKTAVVNGASKEMESSSPVADRDVEKGYGGNML